MKSRSEGGWAGPPPPTSIRGRWAEPPLIRLATAMAYSCFPPERPHSRRGAGAAEAVGIPDTALGSGVSAAREIGRAHV